MDFSFVKTLVPYCAIWRARPDSNYTTSYARGAIGTSLTFGTLTGWGDRIRTCECRYQKPVPYHLATPHYNHQLTTNNQHKTNTNKPKTLIHFTLISAIFQEFRHKFLAHLLIISALKNSVLCVPLPPK